jgi:hypothetical protein
MRPPLLGFGLLAAVLVALAGPSAAAAAPVPVEVCAESREWRRPGPDEMARTVWRDNRYADAVTGAVPERVLAHYTHHFLVFTFSTASGVDHALDMTGLKTSPRAPWPRGLCMPVHDQALGRSRDVVVWALGHRVLGADVAGRTLTLTVEPNSPALDLGYAIVKVPRPGASWTARFVLPDGREIARATDPDRICCADEPGADAPRGLPSALLVPTDVPTGFGAPRAALGAYVLGLRLTYLAPDGTVGLLVLNAPAGCCLDADPRKRGLPVALPNGVTAHFLGDIAPQYGGPILWWVQDGAYVALSGPRLDRDDLVRVAASAAARPVRLPATGGPPAGALSAAAALGLALLGAGLTLGRRRPW